MTCISLTAAVSDTFLLKWVPTDITVIKYLVSSPCLSSPGRAVQDKKHFLVSLPTLSNQDTDVHIKVVLSVWWKHTEQDPPVVVPTLAMAEQGKLPIPVFQVKVYFAKWWKTLHEKKEKKEAKIAASSVVT